MTLSLRGLDHHFGGVHAVADVDLDLRAGEICALLGENGAGKSTLMRAISGALQPDRGQLLLEGEPLPAGDPGEVRRRGISIIYQELTLVGPLAVHENIALGQEARRGPFVDVAAQRELASELLSRLHARIDPDLVAERLSVAEQQLVEIARALAGASNLRVLIMDEPTSALSDAEARRLFEVVRGLASGGVAVVFITHRLEEVFELADRVVVMRDGRLVLDAPTAEQDTASLVQAMVGRPLEQQFPARRHDTGDVRLAIQNLDVPPRVQGVSLQVRAGEIVALAGLVGAGRSEVGRALFGIEPAAAGRILIDGEPVRFRHPGEAIAHGVGWVSEDRKSEGLVLGTSVLANLTLPHLDRFARTMGWIDAEGEQQAALEQIERLRIKAVGPQQDVAELSGGNQQKVSFARWLLGECRVLICDEPTRGVDVGGRYEIYELLVRLAEQGVAILMISSDLPEVLGMADRVVVLHEGRVSGELPASQATQSALLHLAMGHQGPQA